MSDYSEKTKQIIMAVLGLAPSDLIENMAMDSLVNWDSMAHLSIVTGLETEFDIFIEAAEAERLTSFNNIVEFLNHHPEL